MSIAKFLHQPEGANGELSRHDLSRYDLYGVWDLENAGRKGKKASKKASINPLSLGRLVDLGSLNSIQPCAYPRIRAEGTMPMVMLPLPPHPRRRPAQPCSQSLPSSTLLCTT